MASAKPATVPVGSTVGVSATAVTTPEVPMETTTSPTPAPSPSAAAALSPAPAPSRVPSGITRRHGTGVDDLRQVRDGTQRPFEEVRPVGARRRRPVAGPAGVAAVGRERLHVGAARETPRQPVVGQAHRRRTTCLLGLVLGQPAQLGDGERRHRDHADGLRPRPPAHLGTTELLHQVACGRRRAGVVPQQRGPYDVAVVVEADHPVLLPTDRHGLPRRRGPRPRPPPVCSADHHASGSTSVPSG